MTTFDDDVISYFNTKDALEQITKQLSPSLGELKTKLTKEKCPTQDETQAILYSVSKFSPAFADYLKSIKELAKSPEIITELVKKSEREIGITEQSLQTLGQPYGIAINLQNAFWDEKIPTTKHWDRVFELTQWYAYFGSSFTIKSSLISLAWSIKQNFRQQEKYRELIKLYCKHLQSVIHNEYFVGLMLISKRALFLQTANEQDVEKGDIDWWCDKMDSSVFDHAVSYLLGECPKSNDEKVIARLTELVKVKTYLSQETLEKISLFIQNGG
jgi:hypothetical protein